MKAGRDLDVLVAEKVLGCKVVRYSKTSAGCECPRYTHGSSSSSDELKSYSKDLRDAWDIVDKMRADWFSFKMWQPSNAHYEPGQKVTDNAVVSFICSAGPCPKHGTKTHNHHGSYDIWGMTLPLAICMAALVAVKAVPAPKEVFA